MVHGVLVEKDTKTHAARRIAVDDDTLALVVRHRESVKVRAASASVDLAPDGKRIAFTSNRDGNYEIYLMNIDGGGLRNLTAHPANDSAAAWSPDGKKLAFISSRGGGSDIYIMEVK